MPLIDCHTHFFGRTFFRTLVEEAGGSDDMLPMLAAEAKIEIPDEGISGHADRWIAQMDQHGVDHMVTFSSVVPEMEDVAKVFRHYPERLSGFAVINLSDPEAWGHVDRAADYGYKGILLFPVLHGFSVADDAVQGALEVAAGHDMAVVCHFGLLRIKLREILGLPRPHAMRYGNPLDIVTPASRYPGTPFVIPHFGCGFMRETLMAAQMCDNVLVDTSSSNNWMLSQSRITDLSEVFERFLDVMGPDRILFGSDSSVFPRGWRNDIRDVQLEVLQQINAGDAVIQKIFHDNAATLLHLQAATSESM